MRARLLTIGVVLALVPPAVSVCFAADPTTWSATPDPAPASAPAAGESKIRIDLPVKFPDSVKYAFPPSPGALLPFAIVSASGKCAWKVLDLSAGGVRDAAGTGQLDDVVASRDAKYVAGRGLDRGAACQVWSLSAEKRLVNLRPDQSQVPVALGFRGDHDLFLSCLSRNRQTVITETDPESGKAARSYTLPVTVSREGSAISPGGRYLAVLDQLTRGQGLYLCDLDRGTVAGTSAVPVGSNRSTFAGNPVAAAFSPEGAAVGVLFPSGLAYRLIVWDVATGQVSADLTGINVQPDLPGHDQSPLLQFLPGGRGIRVSHGVFDAHTGKQLYTLPSLPGSTQKLAVVELLSEKTVLLATEPSVVAPTTRLQTLPVGQ